MKLSKLFFNKKTRPAEKALETEGDKASAQSEIQEYLDIRDQRRWIFPRAALVGLGAGIMALLFRTALAYGDKGRNALIAWAKQYPSLGWVIPLFVCAIGAALAVFLARRFAPETAGSGIPHLEAVLHRFRRLDWRKVLPVKFIGGFLSIAGGLALGREGPTVQMGGTVGDALSDLLKVSPRERLILISAGAGAGLAAVFNAPLAGLMFVVEEVRRDFQPIVFGAVFVAAIVADVVSRLGAGQASYFIVPSYPLPPLAALPVFAILGIVAGLLGVLYNKALLFFTGLYARLPSRLILPAAAITGALIGLVGWFAPILIGSGGPLAETVLNGNTLLLAIPLFFVLRFLMTTASYGTGAPGGIFAPLLVLGALIGLGIGLVAHAYFPAVVPIPAVFAVVGMAAYFTAIVRAPLTGIMLIIEMTGNYAQMLPLLVACFCAYAVAELLKDLPIYEALLERDLRRSGESHLLQKPVVMEFTVQKGAPFAGREVRSLGLPPGVILVRVSEGKREWVPHADFRLEPHMRLAAVISPEAVHGIESLRHGCESTRQPSKSRSDM